MKKIFLITGVAMLAVAAALVVPGTGKAADVDNLTEHMAVARLFPDGKFSMPGRAFITGWRNKDC